MQILVELVSSAAGSSPRNHPSFDKQGWQCARVFFVVLNMDLIDGLRLGYLLAALSVGVLQTPTLRAG